MPRIIPPPVIPEAGYKYTMLKQNGKEVDLGVYPHKMTLKQLYAALDCETVQAIPTDYYSDLGYGRCTMFADEEGRYKISNYRNPHFNVLSAPGGVEYDVVGDVLKEQKI